jgi:hypothetical protein
MKRAGEQTFTRNVIGGTDTKATFLFPHTVFLPLDDTAQPSSYTSFLSPVPSRLSDQRQATLSPFLPSAPPCFQFIRLLLLPIFRPVGKKKNAPVFLSAIFHFPSHHATRFTVLFWMAEFLVSPKSLQNASSHFVK